MKSAPDGGRQLRQTLAEWPVIYPHPTRTWTLRSKRGWATWNPPGAPSGPIDPGNDPKLTGLRDACRYGRLVGYRFSRRAVVATDRGFVKVVRPSRRDALVQKHQHLSEAFGHTQSHVVVPRVTGVTNDGQVFLEPVRGQSLHSTLRGECQESIDIALAAVGRGLAALHDLAAPEQCDPAGIGPDQGDDLVQWAQLVGRIEPERGRELVAAAHRMRPVVSLAPPVWVHSDFHDKNVLVDGRSVGLIDVDGLRTGSAAEDVANMAVHVHLRALQSGTGEAAGRRHVQLFLDSYQLERSFDQSEYEERVLSTWFRLACLYRYRIASRSLSNELLQRATKGPSGQLHGEFNTRPALRVLGNNEAAVHRGGCSTSDIQAETC